MPIERDGSRVAAVRSRIGQVLLDRWRLIRVLGVGGAGSVYEAVHNNGNRVAIKVLHAGVAASEQYRRRLFAEARAANAIDHPSIVRIQDEGLTSDGSAFLVMELLEGDSCGSMLVREGGPLDPDHVLRWADDLLDAIAAAHDRGILHRDIKPDNLFVTRSGSLKVLDFGVARILEPAAGTSVDTEVGRALGTSGFMAQEQARGRWDEVDQRADIWSVGATLFTLLSGRLVHEAETPNERFGMAMSVPARSLGRVRADLPSAVVAVVDRALEFDPAARWPSARAMREALACARATSSAPSAEGVLPAPAHGATSPRDTTRLEATASIGEDVAPKTRGSRRSVAVVSLAAVCAAVVLGYLAARGAAVGAVARSKSSAPEAATAVTLGAPMPSGAPEPAASPAPSALESSLPPVPLAPASAPGASTHRPAVHRPGDEPAASTPSVRSATSDALDPGSPLDRRR